MEKKKFFAVFSLIACIMLAVACSGNKQEKPKELGPVSVIEVKIEGMTCTGCEQTIQNNVGKLEGIKSVKASFTTGNAIVEYFPSAVDTSKIKEAITGSGYIFNKFIPVQ